MTEQAVALTEPPDGYGEWLADVKARIFSAQQRAALAVNTEMLQVYWQIGRDILARQQAQGWGKKITERLSHDLRAAFPDLGGFSRTNLDYMRAFAEAWPEAAISQQAVGRLPWGHNKFKPEHLGQLGFYMTAVDDMLRHEGDAPTIGLLLCKTKNEAVAEYALRDNTQPLGTAEYQLLEALPEPLQTALPTIEQIERELGEVGE